MTARAALASLLITSLFAGCVVSEAGGAETTQATTGIAGPAKFDDSTGGIEGLVTDPELLPIPNATVGLLPGQGVELSSATDVEGRFSLSHVPPGDHVVVANALGYEPASARVTVEAGRAVQVSLVLTPLPSDAPYLRTFITKVQLSGILWKLTPSCIYTNIDPLLKTCGGVRFNELRPGGVTVFAGCPSCETHTLDQMKDFTEEWQSIVAEMTWKPQSGLTGRGFSFDVNAPNITRGTGGSINQADPKTWQKQTAKSPIVIRIDKATTLEERKIPESDWNNYPDKDCTAPTSSRGNNCDWFFRVFPGTCDLGICPDGFGPDYGIMYEGRAEIFFSYAVREPAPPDFTALPDV